MGYADCVITFGDLAKGTVSPPATAEKAKEALDAKKKVVADAEAKAKAAAAEKDKEKKDDDKKEEEKKAEETAAMAKLSAAAAVLGAVMIQ